MSYDQWVIGGVTPNFINKVSYDLAGKKVTLSCIANYELLSNVDPRVEIALFEALACDHIINVDLLNGGSKLGVSGGSIITVTDGTTTWNAALHKPKYTPDHKSARNIKFELTIDLEIEPLLGGMFAYQPPYFDYDNVSYYEFNQPSNSNRPDMDPNAGVGNEVGHMVITETTNVTEVVVFGSACLLPAWIECNGDRLSWQWSHENSPGDPQGVQRLKWVLDPPAKVITLDSSPHDSAATSSGDNKGCWLQWVKVRYE